MLFMNDHDIHNATTRFPVNSVKHKAVTILQAHKQVVDENSDGWAYWKPPVQAARKLMELIQGPSTVSELTQAECLKLALRPIKAFYTKHPQLPRPKELDNGSSFTLKSLQQTAHEIEAERLTREGLAP